MYTINIVVTRSKFNLRNQEQPTCMYLATFQTGSTNTHHDLKLVNENSCSMNDRKLIERLIGMNYVCPTMYVRGHNGTLINGSANSAIM